jgi:Flp pilus assembly protein TadB
LRHSAWECSGRRPCRVSPAVLWLEVAGAAVALGLLAVYLAILGRAVVTILIAAGLVTLLLLVTFDLDRPTRSLIRVPATPLPDLRAWMVPPAAAAAPRDSSR